MNDQERIESEKLLEEAHKAYEKGDYKTCIELHEKAYELGNYIGAETLGDFYDSGRCGLDEDMEEANKWFIKAAELGSVYAMEQLANNYLYGDGVPEDEAESLRYYQMAADNGSTYGCHKIGKYYYNGEYLEQDYSKSLEYLLKAVDPEAKVKSWDNTSESAAMYLLGQMYENGEGVDKDINQAIEWYKKSAELNSINSKLAILELIKIYQFGKDDVPKNLKESTKWTLELALNGDFEKEQIQGLIDWFTKNTVEDIVEWYESEEEAVDTYCKLGVICSKHLKDNAKAFEFLKYAAELEDKTDTPLDEKIYKVFKRGSRTEAVTRLNVALAYYKNAELTDSKEMAFKWFNKAAELDENRAIFCLGYMYDKGEYVEVNKVKALEYFLRAAELGDSSSTYHIIEYYLNGDGVPQNIPEAFKWIQKVGIDWHWNEIRKIAAWFIDNSLEEIIKVYNNSKVNAAEDCFKLGKIYEETRDGHQKYVAGSFEANPNENLFDGMVALYKKAVELGNTEAMNNLGWIYYIYKHDEDTSAKYYKRAAELGNILAINRLGEYYLEGEGVEKDYKKAVELFTKAAQLGNKHAAENLANCYITGRGVPIDESKVLELCKSNEEIGKIYYDIAEDYNCDFAKRELGFSREKALHCYRKAAEFGNRSVMRETAECLIKCKNTPDYEAEALKWLTKYENGDEPAAMRYLAIMYNNNDDEAKAFEIYMKAAELGDTEAMCAVGHINRDKEDYEEALEWFKKAQELGSTEAACQLGQMYIDGDGVEKDYEKAFAMFNKVYESTDDDDSNKDWAADLIAKCYLKGYGVQQDDEKALEWIMITNNGEEARSMEDIALIYYNVDDPPNYEEAFKWFKRAVESEKDPDKYHRVSDSMFYLGEMYENGYYVERDEAKALEWYIKAAEQFDISAIRKVLKAYLEGRGTEVNIEKAFQWYKHFNERDYTDEAKLRQDFEEYRAGLND